MTSKRFVRFFLIAFPIICLDYFSKQYVHRHIPYANGTYFNFPYGEIGVFQDFFGIDFCISHVTNKGAAWGILGSFQKYLMIFRITMICGLFVYLLKAKDPQNKNALALIIAGAIGNAADYFLYGHVIDMLHFTFWGYSYPVFNVADVAIFLGIIWLLLPVKSRKA